MSGAGYLCDVCGRFGKRGWIGPPDSWYYWVGPGHGARETSICSEKCAREFLKMDLEKPKTTRQLFKLFLKSLFRRGDSAGLAARS